MTDKPEDLTGIPEGEDVGDISSGFGNPDAHHGVSDEKAEAMLAARKAKEEADAAGGQGAQSR